MICDIDLLQAIDKLQSCDVMEGAQRVTTSCLYPDGGQVVVFVYRAFKNEGFVITDDGDAFSVLRSYGIETKGKYTPIANKIAERFEIRFDDNIGHFRYDNVPADKLSSYIMFLANGIQSFVHEINSKREIERDYDLSGRIHEILTSSISSKYIIREYGLTGGSGKLHKFSHAIIRNEQKVLLSPVGNHHASLYPAYAKFSDVAKQHPDYYKEAVIAKSEYWLSANISLISDAVDHLNFIEDGLKPLLKRYELI